MKISVVIPAYNRETLIRDALESALNQTEKIDEIIVIDNDSTDSTFRIAKEYADAHDQVKVYKNEKNVGMISNWNRGIEKATGDYVSVLHSDDIIPPYWCALVRKTIAEQQDKGIGLYFGIYACFEEKNGRRRVISRIKNFSRDTFLPAGDSLRRLWGNFYGNPNCSASIIYKKSIFEEIGYFDPEQSTEADQHFHIRVLQAYPSYFIAKELLYYRRHEFQAFDFKKEVESADTVVKRLFNAIRIQKESLQSGLVEYTYCGVLLYAVKFLLTGRFLHAKKLFSLPGIFNIKTILNFPRFFGMLLYRKYFQGVTSFMRKFGVLIGFTLFCLLVLRQVIFREYESIGHNWDWGFPALSYMFERIRNLSAYAWNPVDLGKNLNLQAHIGVNEIVSLLGSFLSVKASIIVLLVSIFSIAFFSFKKLLDFLGGSKSTLNYLPGILYAFSPFLLNEIIGGSWYMWVSYAFAPLLFLNLIRYVQEGKRVYIFGYVITASFVIISLQNFVTLEFVAALFFLGNFFLTHQAQGAFLLQAKRYFWAHIFLILMNLYWIVPFIDSFSAFYALVTAATFTGSFEGIRNITQNILHVFLMTGYLDRNMYFYAVPFYFSVTFVFFIMCFWAATFGVFLFKTEKRNERHKINTFKWLAILTVITVLIKGGNAPFEAVTMYIFKHFPLMSLYRSPQHLMFAAAFIIPIILFFVLQYYVTRDFSKRGIVSLALILILFWTGAWWYKGDLGSQLLREKNKDHIDFYSLSPELKAVFDYNEKRALLHRVVFLPTASSPLFLANSYQGKAQGGQPEYTHLKNPTLSWESSEIAKKIDDKFCYHESFDFLKYLSLTNTRYIFLREDIYPHHSECGIFKIWNNAEVERSLSAIEGLSSVEGMTGLYQVSDEFFVQRVFIPSGVLVTEQESQNLPDVVSGTYSVGTGVLFQKQNSNKEEGIERAVKLYDNATKNRGEVEFKRINPTKYRVLIRGVQDTTTLVLNESFHTGWKVYPGNLGLTQGEQQFVSRNFHGSIQNDNLSSGMAWETWFQKPVAQESSHLVMNGYANAWILDAKDICLVYPQSCHLNEDGSRDIVVVFDFWPQRLVYLGGGVSFIILFLYIGGIYFSRKIKQKNAGSVYTENNDC